MLDIIRWRLRLDWSFSKQEFPKTAPVPSREAGSTGSNDESGTRKRTSPRSAPCIQPPTSKRASSCTKTRPLASSTTPSTTERQSRRSNSRRSKAKVWLSTKPVNRYASRSKSNPIFCFSILVPNSKRIIHHLFSRSLLVSPRFQFQSSNVC